MIDPQRLRAEKIARQLGAGPNPPSGLVRALQALVEADEKYIPDSPPRWRKPDAGAKAVLKPPAPKPKTQPAPVVTPRVTTPEPEPELTLF